MNETSVSLQVHGETLLLLPERAVSWPRGRTLIVADTHFGKSSHFALHGIAVPSGSDEADRQRLTRLVRDSEAHRLIILGDFLHAPLAHDSPESRELDRWAEQLAEHVEIHVVAGNHDRGVLKSSLASLHWWDSEWIIPPFRFIHDAGGLRVQNDDALFTLSGHVHPVMRLGRRKAGALRVPVFWRKAQGLILPSFGLFTGGFAVVPGDGERMFAAGSGVVVPLG